VEGAGTGEKSAAFPKEGEMNFRETFITRYAGQGHDY